MAMITHKKDIGNLKIPTVVIHEGGYSPNDTLGPCAASLIRGLMSPFQKQ
jgi:hypothetical protein